MTRHDHPSTPSAPPRRHDAADPDAAARERIVEVAAEYFLKHGFSKVTTDELAVELGMSKKTLYKHFATKEELLRACVQQVLRSYTDETSAFLHDPRLSVTEKLQRLMVAVAAQYARIGRTVLEDLRRSAPAIWKEVHDWRQRHIMTEFRRFIREGVAAGVFREDIPDILIVLIYATLVQGMLNPDRASEVSFSMADVFDAVAKVQYEGILTDTGRRMLHAARRHAVPSSTVSLP